MAPVSYTHLDVYKRQAQRWLTVYVYSISASYLVATRAREAGLLVKSKELSGHFAAVFDLDWSEGINPSQLEARTVVVSAAEMV